MEQLTRVLASHYDLSPAPKLTPVLGGTINDNYRALSPESAFFVRVYQGRTLSEIEFEHGLLGHLVAQGFTTIAPVQSTSGQTFVSFDDTWLCVFPWIEGDHVGPDDRYSQVGALLAALHNGAEGFTGVRANPYGIDELTRRLGSFAAEPGLTKTYELLADELALQTARTRQPDTIAHSDLFPDNVLWRHGQPIAIDFEQACQECRIYDVAVAINAWCFSSGDINWGGLHNMLGAYTQDSQNTVSYDQLLWELRRAAMRFCITRITDVYLAGKQTPNKDYREYEARLQLWRQQGAKELADHLGQLVKSE